ncbi:MAG: HAD hydrolase family protein [Melioribacteraceae bacterium]|nr:HAD hydrolase family protein [Melioribacteraceae bacterium]
MKSNTLEKARKIKLVLTDCDGVLTDTGTYYTANGEEMKRFSIRDGMGTERLRKFCNIDTGIVTGENSGIVTSRAAKLNITEVHLGIKDKVSCVKEICERLNLQLDEIAFIGDDTNDIEIMKIAGLTACPSDATRFAKELADIIVESKGGHGAFRDFAELIIEANLNKNEDNN